MLNLGDGIYLVESVSELPEPRQCKELFCDAETTSFGGKFDGLSVWAGGRACGWGLTWDDNPIAYYVPIRHANYDCNLPLDAVRKWLGDWLKSCERWINHNVKFDAHVAKADGIDFHSQIIDTVTHAKLIDSNRGYGRGTYSLDSLSKDWCNNDISRFEERIKPLVEFKVNKRKVIDYGACAPDILGWYGGNDVIANRLLWRKLCELKPESISRVWETESLLTAAIWDMEQVGLSVDTQELQIKQFELLHRMLSIEEQISTLLGDAVSPKSNDDCFKVICGRYGLPILKFTDEEKGSPSFDKFALVEYLDLQETQAIPEAKQAIELMLAYRKAAGLNEKFVEPFLKHSVDGIMHPDFNQCVQTGRMSCSRPNAQQNSKESKALIHPGAGKIFARFDYSQIEFRLIVHYLQNAAAIQAYCENPDTDFHTWVAEMCSIPRKPAKNVNFAIGYGAGKKKVLKMLSANADLMGKIHDEVNSNADIPELYRTEVIRKICEQRAEMVFNKYHATLPELKGMSYQAQTNCKKRGYVFNAYGRRRHLEPDKAFRAFNSVVQSCAADIVKERTVALAPRYNKRIRESGIVLNALVHDELLFTGEQKAIEANASYIGETLEQTSIPFRVPIRVAFGMSGRDWAEASSDDADRDFRDFAIDE